MFGLKTIEEFNFGNNILHWFITSSITKFLHKNLPKNYFAGANELGLHLSHKTNFSAGIATYRDGQLKVGFHSVNYEQKPPNVIIEVDVKIDKSDYFRNEEEYFHKKTEKLLQ